MPAKKKVPAKSSPAISGGLLIPEKIAPLVHLLRHEKVILDSDLAELYGVSTKRLNEAVKRNLDRFPSDFMFQVTEDELEILRSQIATSRFEQPNLRFQSGISSSYGGRRYLPYVFTEQGVAMLSSVLRSPASPSNFRSTIVGRFPSPAPPTATERKKKAEADSEALNRLFILQ